MEPELIPIRLIDFKDWINGIDSLLDITYGAGRLNEDEMEEFNKLEESFEAIPDSLIRNFLTADKLLDEASSVQCEPTISIKVEAKPPTRKP